MSDRKFHQLMNQYKIALNKVIKQVTPNKALIKEVLDVRDQLQVLLADNKILSPTESFLLLELDQKLRQQSSKIIQTIDLKLWRGSFLPSPTAWWWFLDDSSDKHKKQTEIIQSIFVGTIMVFTITLSVEIIQRFWAYTSDTISVIGTLLTILLTASPFVKQGEDVSDWVLTRLPFLKLKNISDLRIAGAVLSLIILLVLRIWILPGPLATYYNNLGVTTMEVGNLNMAQKMFQRAAALNPDRVVPYHNIADSYKELGLENQAIEWYQKAVERDSNFAPAYRGLGELYNHKGDYQEAEAILLAGLSLKPGDANESLEKITSYELLSNLGWSYWGQDKRDYARATLENALSLEADLKALGESHGVEYRLALPHFYLAQIYEQIGEKEMAIQQWEECLRLLDKSDWHQRERYFIAQQHLLLLTK